MFSIVRVMKKAGPIRFINVSHFFYILEKKKN